MNNLTIMQKFFSKFKRKKKEKEPVLNSIDINEDIFSENWFGYEAAAYIFQEEENKKKQKVRKK